VPSVTTSDGVDVAVHDLGGEGHPALLAHATGLHGLVWTPLAARLADRFHCVSFDARGHGDSGLPSEAELDWYGFARDVLAVVDGLGLERPYGVGHSSGATALLLAEEARPGTFEALYCFEPVIVPVHPPLGRDRGNWLASAARRRREVFPSRADALGNYASKPPFASVEPDALRAYVDHGFEDLDEGGVRLKCRAETEAVTNEMASAHDCFGRLSRVRCPVALAGGSETDAVGPSTLEAQARPLPLAHTEVLPGLTHLGPLEDPEAVALSIRRFFGRQGPAMGAPARLRAGRSGGS
jgi:pimeloyl-ACP methyl ester carboxylesterase